MKRTFFLIICLLNGIGLQANSLSFECPCRAPKPPQPTNPIHQESYFSCGCGGGGGGQTDQIPPDQG